MTSDLTGNFSPTDAVTNSLGFPTSMTFATSGTSMAGMDRLFSSNRIRQVGLIKPTFKSCFVPAIVLAAFLHPSLIDTVHLGSLCFALDPSAVPVFRQVKR
jgi:hypothetical protein